MSSPTLSAFEDHPLPSWHMPEAVYLQPGTAGKGSASCSPAAAFPVAGYHETKQQHTLVVVTTQERLRAESMEKTQPSTQHKALFVKTLRSEPVDSPMQIFPLGV